MSEERGRPQSGLMRRASSRLERRRAHERAVTRLRQLRLLVVLAWGGEGAAGRPSKEERWGRVDGGIVGLKARGRAASACPT